MFCHLQLKLLKALLTFFDIFGKPYIYQNKDTTLNFYNSEKKILTYL